MSRKPYATLEREHARLILLRDLASESDERSNSAILQEKLRYMGIDQPREWVHQELRWLANMGALVITDELDSVLLAQLTEKGARHLRRAEAIDGVKRPSRPES